MDTRLRWYLRAKGMLRLSSWGGRGTLYSETCDDQGGSFGFLDVDDKIMRKQGYILSE